MVISLAFRMIVISINNVISFGYQAFLSVVTLLLCIRYKSCKLQICHGISCSFSEHCYDTEDLLEAVGLHKSGEYSTRQLSLRFNIPRRTLRDHLSNPHMKPFSEAVFTELTPSEEQSLVDYALYLSEHNFQVSRKDLKALIVVNQTAVYICL